jgi:putative transposase
MLKFKLEDCDVNFLMDFVRKGRKSARELTRARILLLANEQKRGIDIAKTLGVCRNTVLTIKKRYAEEGLQSALKDKPRPGHPRKYSEKQIAEVIALACTPCPDGRKRWTLTLLRDELRKKEGFETIGKESIRLILKESNTKP